MPEQIEVNGLSVHLTRKKMKNIRLAVKPPHGDIRVSAPMRAPKAEILRFVAAHTDWIRQQQYDISERYKEPRLQYEDGETLYLWGEEKRLRITQLDGRSSRAYVDQDSIVLSLPKHGNLDKKRQLVKQLYREELNHYLPPVITHYQAQMNVDLKQWRLKYMKTLWGSCNTVAHRIWLNVGLAAYPKRCAEYVVVHELAHLIERYHNKAFWQIVGRHCPAWQEAKAILNSRQLNLE